MCSPSGMCRQQSLPMTICWASWTHKSQTHRGSLLLLLPRAWSGRDGSSLAMVAALLLETPPWLSIHGRAGAPSWPHSHYLSWAVAQVSPAAVACCPALPCRKHSTAAYSSLVLCLPVDIQALALAINLTTSDFHREYLHHFAQYQHSSLKA